MQRNIIIGAIVLIVIIVVGALAITMLNNTQTQLNSAGFQDTKLAWSNNGTTWLHIDAIYENVTCKNGTVNTFYSEMYIKPNSTLVVDLSKMAGYDGEKLPPGTKITILAWKGLLNETNMTNVTNANLNLTMQGWSNTQNPVSSDQYYNIVYPGLPIDPLPANVIDNMLFMNTTIQGLDLLEINGTNDAADEPLFEQEILTVDKDGKVTLTMVTAPELCKMIAHII